MNPKTLVNPIGHRVKSIKAFFLSSLSVLLYTSLQLSPVQAKELGKAPTPAVKTAPSTPGADVALIAKARRAEVEDRYDAACDYLSRAIALNPENAEAYYYLSLFKGRQQKYQLAVDNAKKCLRLRPNYAPAHSVLGRAYAGLGDYKAAGRELAEAVNLDPNNATTYSNLAAVKGLQKNYTEAATIYRQALKINPNSLDAHLGLASALNGLNDKAGQIASYRDAVKVAPKSSVAHGKLGYALSQSGDTAGGMSEIFKSNMLRVQESWNDFLGMFLTAWASVFLAFAAIFAVLFAGSRFKPQEGEIVLRSFFLTFYKDKPGRFVVTDTRIVFVPESFSAWFGATRVSIQRPQIESINYLSTVGGGTVSILTRDKSVHQFRMPLLVLDPVRSLLVSQGLTAPDPDPLAVTSPIQTTEAKETSSEFVAAKGEQQLEAKDETKDEKN